MDNSVNRLQAVFFYGLYMDPEILRLKGVKPRNPRIATVSDYSLRIVKMTTLLRAEGFNVNGIVYSLTHSEIEILYSKSGLDMYVPEAILSILSTGEIVAALICNLLVPPDEDENNSDYRNKLLACMKKLNVPTTNM